MKLIRRKYISISEVISLSYRSLTAKNQLKVLITLVRKAGSTKYIDCMKYVNNFVKTHLDKPSII